MFNFVLLLEICSPEQLLPGSSLSRSNFEIGSALRSGGVEREKEGTRTRSMTKQSARTLMRHLDSHSEKPAICAVSIFS